MKISSFAVATQHEMSHAFNTCLNLVRTAICCAICANCFALRAPPTTTIVAEKVVLEETGASCEAALPLISMQRV